MPVAVSRHVECASSSTRVEEEIQTSKLLSSGYVKFTRSLLSQMIGDPVFSPRDLEIVVNKSSYNC